MLSVLRKHSRSTIIKVLFAMIAVSFLIGFGAMGYVRRTMKKAQGAGGVDAHWIARINGEDIPVMAMARAERNIENMYRAQLGDMADTMLQQLDLTSIALNQLITQRVIEIIALQMGLTVPDAEVADTIYRNPSFQEGGRFNKDRYFSALRRQRLTAPEYEDSVRRELLTEKLRNLVASSAKVAESDVRDEFFNREDKVNLEFVKLTPDQLETKPAVTDEQAKAYFEADKEKFKLPEKRRVNYVAFKPEDYADKLTFSQEQIKKYYDANKEKEFKQPEQIQARHILIKVDQGADEAAKSAAQAKAEALRKKLADGAEFAALAKENSDDPGSKAKGGELGWFGRGRMVKAFEDAAFALKPGELSAVVESPYGFHIIQTMEKRPEKVAELAEANDRIVAALKREEGMKRAKADALAFKQKLGADADLMKAATDAGLKPAASAPFPANQAIQGVGKGLDASRRAFEMKLKDVSEPHDGGLAIYVFQLAEIIAAHVPEFEEVQDKARDEYRQSLEQKALAQKAEVIIKALEGGQSLEKAAGKLDVQETGLFARNATAAPKIGVAPDLMAAAFAADKPGQILPAPYKSGNGVVVCVLKERTKPTDADFAVKKEEVREDLQQKKAQLTLQAWVEQAEKTIKIERNDELIASLQARGGKVPMPRAPRAPGQAPLKVTKTQKKEKPAEDGE